MANKLSALIRGLFKSKNKLKEIDIKTLPSQGIFYSDDFWIKIQMVSPEEVEYYKNNYTDDPLKTISMIKRIVKDNITLPKDKRFFDILSVDVIYIFFEMVKYTRDKEIMIRHDKGDILINEKNFNYFQVPEKYKDKFDNNKKEFIIDGFRFKLPTIGAENSITEFLTDKLVTGNVDKYKDLSVNFLYFLGDRKELSKDDIENLYTIFNEEISSSDYKKVDKIVNDFKGFNTYSVIHEGEVIKLNGLDLSRIWE